MYVVDLSDIRRQIFEEIREYFKSLHISGNMSETSYRFALLEGRNEIFQAVNNLVYERSILLIQKLDQPSFTTHRGSISGYLDVLQVIVKRYSEAVPIDELIAYNRRLMDLTEMLLIHQFNLTIPINDLQHVNKVDVRFMSNHLETDLCVFLT